MIQLHTLGPVNLTGPSAAELRALLSQPKRLALLVYLAMPSPGTVHRRDTLLAMLWPELDEPHARGALRGALFDLRSALGPDALNRKRAEDVALEPAAFWCDAAAFDQALTRHAYRECVSLYRGDFLGGFHLSGCAEFERWLDVTRARLRERAVEAGFALADVELQNGRVEEAVRWARWARDLAPDDELVVQKLITVLGRAGDRAGALRTYEEFAHHLGVEYRAEPAPATRRLLDQLLASAESAAITAPPTPGSRDQPGVTDQTAARGPWRRVTVLVGAVLALIVAGLSLARDGRGTPRILVGVPANATGDSTLDRLGGAMADWLARALVSSGAVAVVPPGVALRVRAPVSRDLSGPPPLLHAFAREKHASTIVWGLYESRADSLTIQLRITDGGGGGRTWELPPVTVGRDAVADALDSVTARVSLDLADRFGDRRLALRAQIGGPPSWPAYREHVKGLEQIYTVVGTMSGALQHFRRAVALDSTFHSAALWAALMHVMRREYDSADSLLNLVMDRRHVVRPLTRLDRALLDWLVSEVGFRPEDARLAVAQLADLMPDDEFIAYRRVEALQRAARYAESVDLLRRLDPARYVYGSYWWMLTGALHRLGRHQEELAAVRDGRKQFPTNTNFDLFEAYALAALGRTQDLDSLVARLGRAGPLRTGRVLRDAGGELILHGHGDAARALLDQAIRWHAALPDEDFAKGWGWSLVDALVYREDYDSATAVARRLGLASPDAVGTRGYLGELAAARGDTVEARRQADWLTRVPSGSQKPLAVCFRSQIAAWLGEREDAMSLLRQCLHGAYTHADLHLWQLWWGPLRKDPEFQRLLRPVE